MPQRSLSFMFLFVALAAIAMTTNAQYDDESVDTSRLQIQIPLSLKKDGGYEHKEALFGMPPYGGSIEQNVYFADADLCDPAFDYSRGGFPTRGTDESGAMEAFKSPFILMVDRGSCTFVKKARNAQKAGAAAMIIADTTCLCIAGDSCVSAGEAFCETKEPIMADDGSGSDVTIPSFLMYKQDADPIKEVLIKNQIVRMTMSWALPRQDSRVEYSMWTTPSDNISIPLQREFRHIAWALGESAKFTPRMYVYDGVYAGCKSPTGENQCYNLCTNNGRYCSTDPDENLDSGISGADVVAESLRRICIWNEYGKDGIGMPWWDYVDEFIYRCNTDDYFASEDCVKDCMERSNVDYNKIKTCIDDSGGLEVDDENTLLDKEISAKTAAGVVIVPSFFVNNAPLRGAPKTAEIFEAICSGYAPGHEPHPCKKCLGCDDIVKCVSVGHCPGSSEDSVSWKMFIGTLSGVVIGFSILGVIQWQKSQREMRSQIRGIMAEYMPLDANAKAELVGIPDDDDDDLHIEIS